MEITEFINMKGKGIYYILNLINGKCYIGSSKCMHRRKGCHISAANNGKHRSKKMQNAFNKYGVENFEFGVVCFTPDAKTEKELQDIEQRWIDLIKPEYNTRKKAQRSSYIEEKNARANRKKYTHSQKTKDVMSLKSKGHSRGKGKKRNTPSPMKGKKHSHPHPKGKDNPNYGRVQSKEEIEKRIGIYYKNQQERFDKTLKPIIQLDLKGNFIKEWRHLAESAKELGIRRKLIALVLKGINNTANKFIFIYKDEYSNEEVKHRLNNIKIIRSPSEKDIVYQYDLNGMFIREWSGVREASKNMKIARVGIIAVCKGKKNKAGGYIWKKKIDVINSENQIK